MGKIKIVPLSEIMEDAGKYFVQEEPTLESEQEMEKYAVTSFMHYLVSQGVFTREEIKKILGIKTRALNILFNYPTLTSDRKVEIFWKLGYRLEGQKYFKRKKK